MATSTNRAANRQFVTPQVQNQDDRDQRHELADAVGGQPQLSGLAPEVSLKEVHACAGNHAESKATKSRPHDRREVADERSGKGEDHEQCELTRLGLVQKHDAGDSSQHRRQHPVQASEKLRGVTQERGAFFIFVGGAGGDSKSRVAEECPKQAAYDQRCHHEPKI